MGVALSYLLLKAFVFTPQGTINFQKENARFANPEIRNFIATNLK